MAGYFKTGGELTSGMPDWKEGLYLGSELGPDHPLVRAGTPVHGPNLWPDLPAFRDTVLAYLEAVTGLGHALMRGIALSLELPADYFADRYTADPLILFRLFNYPSRPAPEEDSGSRWDQSNVHTFAGSYGDYLLGKIGKVFPELQQQVL